MSQQGFEQVVGIFVLLTILGCMLKLQFDPFVIFRPFLRWGRKQPGRFMRALKKGFKSLKDWTWCQTWHHRQPLARIGFGLLTGVLIIPYIVVAMITDIFFPGGEKK